MTGNSLHHLSNETCVLIEMIHNIFNKRIEDSLVTQLRK